MNRGFAASWIRSQQAGAMVGAVAAVPGRRQGASEVGRCGKGSSSSRARRVSDRGRRHGNVFVGMLEGAGPAAAEPVRVMSEPARVVRRHRSSPKPAVANTYAASARSKRHELRGLEQDSTFEMVIP
jgi:hypothetical protein